MRPDSLKALHMIVEHMDQINFMAPVIKVV